MNMRLRLSRSDMLNLDGVPYRPVQCDENYIVLERADQPGIIQSLTYAEVHDLLQEPENRFLPGYYELAR